MTKFIAAFLLSFALLAGHPAGGASKPGSLRLCIDTKVEVHAGASARINLDCRIRRGGKSVTVVRGSKSVASRTITLRPRIGSLSRFRPKAGVVKYRAGTSANGSDRFRFRVRLKDGRRFGGRILIDIGKRIPGPGPDPDPDPDPAPEDGIPAELPAGIEPAITYSVANWSPSGFDTCPKSLHDRFVVIGPDGLKYPTWHPPTVTDPATGETCSFGHEHGRDPSGSDLFPWVKSHFASPGQEKFAGIPFGLASQALETWSESNSMPLRREDNPGYKIDFRNDIRLYGRNGADLAVTCDLLIRYHQGSHSADATSNNVHETMFAYRCDDGTELISNAFTRYGNAGEYNRACEPEQVVKTTDNGYPDGVGGRFIPDRACMETHFLVAPGRTTSAFALWEQWIAQNRLYTGSDPEAGETVARFYTRFDIFDPSRYADPDPSVTPEPGYSTRIGRPLDLCWEALPGARQVDRGYTPCATATAGWSLPAQERPPYDDPVSPFRGAEREVRFRGATVSNLDGPEAWYTDPYGGNASTSPFPGAICQLVSDTDNSNLADVQERTFKSPEVSGFGVHPPN